MIRSGDEHYIMFRNRENFRRYLLEENINFEDVPFQDGGHGFRLLQTLENGPRLILGVSFNSDDTIVDIKIYNIAKIDNPLKKEFLYALLNELNDDYRFTKFVEDDGEITASYSMSLLGIMDYSELIFDTLVMIFNSVKEEFPKFMKLQWG